MKYFWISLDSLFISHLHPWFNPDIWSLVFFTDKIFEMAQIRDLTSQRPKTEPFFKIRNVKFHSQMSSTSVWPFQSPTFTILPWEPLSISYRPPTLNTRIRVRLKYSSWAFRINKDSIKFRCKYSNKLLVRNLTRIYFIYLIFSFRMRKYPLMVYL